MIKQIYLASRNPRTTHAEFLENWRAHARLSASFPSIHDPFLGIAQCGLVQGLARGDLTDRYDGVNLLPVRGVAEALEVYNDPDIDVMLADELRVFSGPVSETAMMTVETVLTDSAPGRFLLLEVVRRRPGATVTSFAKAWLGPRVRGLRAMRSYQRLVGRHALDLVILDQPAALSVDGVGELWFDDLDQGLEFLDDPEFVACSSDDEHVEVVSRAMFRSSYLWSR
jgi:hypothetical protein